jgi:uncharacterized RDD family membrane protein YckC
MKCPKCGYISFDGLDNCKRCGVAWNPGPRAAALDLKAEGASVLELELTLDSEFDRLYDRLKEEEERALTPRAAGLARRSLAGAIDGLVISFLSTLFFTLARLSLEVGLAAHPIVATDKWLELLQIVMAGWILLIAAYSVLCHAWEGQTVGKWALGLRLSGVEREAVTYGRALFRWIAGVPVTMLGLGLLWALFDPKRRALHDVLAGTQVVRLDARD